tara:strand:- start:311 stop:538 length:228 start_codon:yes stop_codon:yes gene_type:complete
MVYLGHNENNSRKDFIMTDSLFAAELRDAARYNELVEQRAEMLDAVQEAELYIGEPVMHLQNDLYMVFDDPDYFG